MTASTSPTTRSLSCVQAPTSRGVWPWCAEPASTVSGLLPDGRTARFLALGHMTGDWGGGMGLAQEVMWWSVRAEDGRGPSTALSAAVAAHFVLPSAMAVAESVHLHRISRERLHELVPLLFRVAGDGDPVARSIVERQAREVVSLASIALRRLRLDTRAGRCRPRRWRADRM